MFLFFRKYVRRFHQYYIFLIILFLLPVLIIMNESQALVAIDDGPTDYVRSIMRQIIAHKTRLNYIGNNVL